ncbi:MAG TPA: hypothetical protein VD838_10900 [Anaeromyxobacteraceae bacterium]|nr:hypothetical protein [Anaeromyxobacteraceae bacterium]
MPYHPENKAYMVRCHRCRGVIGVAALTADGAGEMLREAAEHGDLIETTTAGFIRGGEWEWCDCEENEPTAMAPAQPDLFTTSA